MTNSLVVYEQFEMIQRASMALYRSGYWSDAKSEAQAIVKVMAGAELGLPPFASMSGIHIVQGKPVIGANLIAALVKNDPRYDYRVKRADNEACVIVWYENGQAVGESSFTRKEAADGKVDSSYDKDTKSWKVKPTWNAYPSDMLFARAISRGARRYAPGIFGGAPVYTPDEMGVDTDEDGHIIDGEAVEVQPAAAPPAPEPVADGVQYGNGDAVTARALEYYDLYVAEFGDAPQDYNALKRWYTERQKQAAEQLKLVDAPAGGGAYAE